MAWSLKAQILCVFSEKRREVEDLNGTYDTITVLYLMCLYIHVREDLCQLHRVGQLLEDQLNRLAGITDGEIKVNPISQPQ